MEESKKQPKSLPGMSIEWYESLKTDEDWLEYRTIELMDAGFSEKEISELFYYDSATRRFYPTAKMMEQWDDERQWFQEDRSYYLDAIAKGRRNPFPNRDFNECQGYARSLFCDIIHVERRCSRYGKTVCFGIFPYDNAGHNCN